MIWVATIILFLVIGGLFLYMAEIHLQLYEVRKDIQSVIAPKFLTVSPETNDLIELAIDMWRLESRFNKMSNSLESQREIVHNSIKKIKRYLDKNDIEIVDHTNQKFNDGRNLDILSVETDSRISQSIIKETKEPTIMFKGQVVRKGKVIILAKNTEGFEGVKND